MKLNSEQVFGYVKTQLEKAKAESGENKAKRLQAAQEVTASVEKLASDGTTEFEVEIFKGPDGEETFDLQAAAFSADGTPKLDAANEGATGQGVATNLDELQKSLDGLISDDDQGNEGESDDWPEDMNANDSEDDWGKD